MAKIRVTRLLIILVSFLLGPGTVVAQIEEIVVTATKREVSSQNVSITLSAFEEEQFRELGASDITRIADQIPSVITYGTGSNVQSFHVRGIGLTEFAGNFDTPVAIHYDEVFISKNWMVLQPNFDIQRVEVLKGPQGTLFGRNTTGGSVNFYTNDPTREFKAGFSVGGDNHERYTIDGFISGPITDKLSGRLAVLSQISDGGPWDNLFNGEEIGGHDNHNLRGKLLWESDGTTVRLTIHGSKDNGDLIPNKAPGVLVDFTNPANAGQFNCPEALTGEVTRMPSTCLKFGNLAAIMGLPNAEFEPDDINTVNVDFHGTKRYEAFGGNIRIEHDIGWGQITSITAYEYFDRDDRADADAAILASANSNFYNQLDEITQEFRLTGEAINNKLRYTVGVFYQNDELIEIDGADLSENPLGLAPPFIPSPYFYADFKQEIESVALFTHNEYDINDKFTINVGFRATWDSIDFRGLTAIGLNDPTGRQDRVTPCLITTFNSFGDRFAPGCAGIAAFIPLPVDTMDGSTLRDSRSDNDFSFRTGIDYKPNDDVLLYASYTTGYRSGGFSAPFAGVITEFAPEDMTAIEGGLKSLLFDNTVQLNAAVFWYEYEDLQVNVNDPVSPIVPITRNIGKSETIGFETEILWSPDEHWTLKTGVGYLDAEFKDTTRAVTTYNGVIPLAGNRPLNTPEWTFNGLVRYQRPIMAGWNLILMADFRWTDDRFLEATNQVFDRAPDYWIANARGAIASQDRKWELAVWGKNIFNEDYLNYINNIPFFKLETYSEPVSYGATFTYRY